MKRRSLVLDTTARLVFDAALVLSLYLLFAGHNQPGGGFVGGLVAAAAIALRYIAGGLDEIRLAGRVRPWTFQAIGLTFAAGVALWSVLVADAPLDSRVIEWQVVGLGKLKASTTTLFDTGVYLIVVGLMLMIFEGLGDDTEEASPRQGGGRR